jgi:hypothetical protein
MSDTRLEDGLRMEIDGERGEWVECTAHAVDCDHSQDKLCNNYPVKASEMGGLVINI